MATNYTLSQIASLPRHIEHELTEGVFTEGFGFYHIHIYTKGNRRYFEVRGWYTGLLLFSASINADPVRMLELVKEVAGERIDRYRKQN